MKNTIKSILFFLIIGNLIACSPQDNDDHALGSIPDADASEFSITPSADNPNVVIFKKTNNRGGVAVWDLGNGVQSNSTGEITGEYPFKGEYTVTMQLYTTGGLAETITKKLSIPQTNFDMLDTPLYNNITGGLAAVPAGKTWRIDGTKENSLSLTIGGDVQWGFGAGEVTPYLADDDFTLILSDERKAILDNKAVSFLGIRTKPIFENILAEVSGLFLVAIYQPATDASWALSNTPEGDFLILTNTFPCFAWDVESVKRGVYKVESHSQDELHLSFACKEFGYPAKYHCYLTSKPR